MMGRKLIPGVDKIKEEWVKKEIKKIFKDFQETNETYFKWWMPQASTYGESGQHDFSICYRGLLLTIEAKAGRNKPTENQISFAVDIAHADGISLLINEGNLTDIVPVLSHIHLYSELPHSLGHDFAKYRKA